MQRTAVQAGPDMMTAITGRWTTGARRIRTDVHPFRKHLEALEIGVCSFSARSAEDANGTAAMITPLNQSF